MLPVARAEMFVPAPAVATAEEDGEYAYVSDEL